MSKYKFCSLPKKLDVKDYTSSKNKIVEKYKDTPGLISIYEWGSVSHPGISDIDIVFVFKKNSKKLGFSKRSYSLMDKTTRYLARHPFVFVDEQSFRDIHYIYKNTEFNLLNGKNIKLKKLSKNEIKSVQIATLNDIIIRHLPRDFMLQEVQKNINVRDTLLRLNSLKYSLKTLEEITGKRITKYNSVLKEIESLRKMWFRTKNKQKVAELNKKAIDISLEIIDMFQKFLLKKKIVTIDNQIVRYKGIKNQTKFVKWQKEKAKDQMLKSASQNKYKSILPIVLAPQLTEYSKQNGPISRQIQKNLSKVSQYNIGTKDILRKRIKILNNQALLAKKLKHSDFAAFFDFGYRSKSGVNNWVLQILDRIRF